MSDLPTEATPVVICAPCDQGRHSNIGPPEYGSSAACPEPRCGCDCRKPAKPKKPARRAKESR